MAKSKKSIWSIALGVVMCFAFAIGIVSSTYNPANAATSSPALETYSAIMSYFDSYDTSVLTETTKIVSEDNTTINGKTRLELYFVADAIYNGTHESLVLTEAEKSNFMVKAGKAQWDTVWTEIFEAPHAVIDQINNDLGDMLARGVIYSDKTEFNTINGAYEALDSEQKAYVRKNTSNLANLRDVQEDIMEIEEHIRRVVTAITDELGAMLDAGVKLADEARWQEIVNDYNALDHSAQAYVQSEEGCAVFHYVADVENAIKAIKERLETLAEKINGLDSIITKVKLADEPAFRLIEKEYNELTDSDEIAYVNARATIENIDTVNAELNAIYARLDALAKKINNLSSIITKVKLADEDAFRLIEKEYNDLTDSDEIAYVQKKATVANIDTVNAELNAIYARLNDLVKDINGLSSIIGNVKLADEDLYDEINTEYVGLTDADELAYVNENATEENLTTVKAELDAIYARLNALAEKINNLSSIITKVKLADEDAFRLIEKEYNDLTDSDEIAYVQKKATVANIDTVNAELNAIYARLNDLVKDINGLSSIIGKVTLADEALYDEINDEYVGLTDTDELAYVNKNATEENLATVKAEIDAIYARLDALVEKINNLKTLIENGVTLADEAAFELIEEEYAKLETVYELPYVNGKADNGKNITTVRELFNALYAVLDALIEDITVDFANMLERGVALTDAEAFNAVTTALQNYLSAGQRMELDYIKEDASDKEHAQYPEYTNVYLVYDAFQALTGKLTDLATDINNLKDVIDDVKLSDEDEIDRISDAYDALTEDEKTFVNGLANEENIQGAKDALQDLIDELDQLAKDIDALEPVIADVKLSDEKEINRIDEAYNALSEENKAYVDKKADEANVKEAVDALQALVDKLDALVDDINNLDSVIADVKLSDKDTIEDVDKRYTALSEENKKYVDERAEEENIQDAKDALQALIDELDQLASDINALEPNVINDVQLSDEPVVTDVENRYNALSEENKEYVDKKANSGNIELAKKAISDLKAELDQLATDINNLEANVINDVQLSDEPVVTNVENRYNALTEENKAYVDKKADEENIQGAKDAIAALKAELDQLAKDIDALAPVIADVKLSDETEINRVDEAYAALSEENKAYVNDKAVEKNIEDAKNALQALKDKLNQLITDIDNLESVIADVKLSDKDTIEDVDNRYTALTEENKAYVDKEADEANIQEAKDALAALIAELDQLVSDINALSSVIADVKYSDEATITDVDNRYAALTEENKEYVNGKADEDNIEKAKAEFAKLVEEMNRIIGEINNLGTLLDNGVKYSDKANLDLIVDDLAQLDPSAQAYVVSNSTYDNVTKVDNSLVEIANRVTAVKEAIAKILYRLNDQMVADKTGDVVYGSQESVDAVTALLTAVYNGDKTENYSIATIEYKWNEKEITALVNANIIDNLADYDNALAILEAYQANAKAVAGEIDALTLTVDNNYKTQEDKINSIYNAYVALDLGLFNNTQNYIDEETRVKIEVIKSTLEELNAWILKVALLVDSNATAETADEVIANADVSESLNFNIDTVNALLDEYNTLVTVSSVVALFTNTVDEVKVASLADAYNLLNSIVDRIKEITKELDEIITEILDRNPELVEDDFYTIQDVADIYEQLDETQKEALEEALQPDYTYEEFRDLANKFLFYLYFKSAVEELYAQVGREYFTVEGYVQEKSLLSMYHNFDDVMKAMVESCYDKLIAIDEAYATADLLDYNKIKDELIEADAKLREEITNAYETADKALEEAMTKADADLKASLEAADAELKAALESAMAKADADLKAALEEAIAKTNGALKEELEKAYNDADAALKASLEEADASIRADYESDLNALKTELTTKIDNIKAELEKVKAELEAEIAALRKKVIIGAVVIGSVLAVVVVCVVVLFVRTKKAKKAKNNEEANETKAESQE